MYQSELTGRTKQERGHGGFLPTREKGSIVGIRASCGRISENLWNIRVAQSCLYPSAGTAGNAVSIRRKASDRSNQSMEAESSSSFHAFILRPWAILDYHALNEAFEDFNLHVLGKLVRFAPCGSEKSNLSSNKM